jgi:glycosyltransferase involved in cell wall biosynthesis
MLRRFHLERFASLRRLMDREVKVPEYLVHSYWAGEIAEFANAFIRSRGQNALSENLTCFGMMRYAAQAQADVALLAPNCAVYHFRAGFGGPSVALAKRLGLKTICDHSIVHPELADQLIGVEKPTERDVQRSISPFWRLQLDDIDAADHVLVNSDFVKETFGSAGVKTKNVHVIYLGVDNEYLDAVSLSDIVHLKASRCGRVPELLFAGGFNKRKGAIEIIDALRKIEQLGWSLKIAGTVDREILETHGDFFRSARVECLSWMPRKKLARVMAEADIFLFPSRAEGSARVVFEALASGCYVVTTRNSGSIVEDGRHGAIVPVNNSDQIAQAIVHALSKLEEVRQVGIRNAELVRRGHTQAQYGRALERLYGQICCDDKAIAS